MSSITPLYILLSVMRRKWKEDDVDGAVALAKVAAPYMHPKVPAARPVGDLSGVSDDELDRIEREIGAGYSREGSGES
ncbi:MAG: hypothetical protein RQ966_15885 [Acetobacteraceae bacterium]|nr:hypothetical protein [Acetobacteraceae bacterium]